MRPIVTQHHRPHHRLVTSNIRYPGCNSYSYFYGEDSLAQAEAARARHQTEYPGEHAEIEFHEAWVEQYEGRVEAVTRIAFDRVGALPAPAGLAAPKICLSPLWRPTPGGAVQFAAGEDGYKPTYSFTPMGSDWTGWAATGSEDCECGEGQITAVGPDGKTYRWDVDFCHDGDSSLEFWGMKIAAPDLID